MTFVPMVPPRPRRATSVAEYLKSGIVGTAFALPLALLWGEGGLRIVGICYAIVYGLVLAPSTGVYVLFGVDALLLFVRKRPVMLPDMLAFRAAGARGDRVVVHRWLERLAEFSVDANPIANLVIALLDQACRWRSDEIRTLWAEARAKTVRAQRSSSERRETTPAFELAEPVFDRVTPELVCA